MEVSKELADYFYEQVAGSYSGHMSMIPNSPVIYGLLKAHSSEKRGSTHAIPEKEFAEFLECVASHFA